MKPRLLDLFCGAGGAAMGYSRAGFEVIGVDVRPQPNYPFQFIQADAVKYLDAFPGPWFRSAGAFDVIHASPPCQAFSTMSNRWRGKGGLADNRPELIAPIRERLIATGLPWVIENVEGAAAEMQTTLRLHGGMFGLRVRRPRLFESNVLMLAPMAAYPKDPLAVYGHSQRKVWTRVDGSEQRTPRDVAEMREVMDMPWAATWHEMTEAIPPAYTEYIGQQLVAHLQSVAA